MFWMIVIIVLMLPLVKAIADRIGSLPPANGVDLDLRRELEQVRSQLQDNQDRIGAMETRLDFYEKLIEARPSATELPPGGDPSDPKIIT